MIVFQLLFQSVKAFYYFKILRKKINMINIIVYLTILFQKK